MNRNSLADLQLALERTRQIKKGKTNAHKVSLNDALHLTHKMQPLGVLSVRGHVALFYNPGRDRNPYPEALHANSRSSLFPCMWSL
jgi:hypothetical protein